MRGERRRTSRAAGTTRTAGTAGTAARRRRSRHHALEWPIRRPDTVAWTVDHAAAVGPVVTGITHVGRLRDRRIITAALRGCLSQTRAKGETQEGAEQQTTSFHRDSFREGSSRRRQQRPFGIGAYPTNEEPARDGTHFDENFHDDRADGAENARCEEQ